MKRIFVTGRIAVIISLAGMVSVFAQTPPVAPVRPVVDEHWGVKVSDPYRYMENLEDPEVQAWFKSQATFADSILRRLPERDKILARIKELDAGLPYKIFGIKRMPDGRLFYYRQAAEDDMKKLYWRQGLSGEEHLLINPTELVAPDGGHYSLYFHRPSPDGRYVCYGLAPSGSEDVALRVYDVSTGTNLPESIDRLEPYYTPPQWLPDGSGFFYNRLRLLPPEAPPTEAYKRSRTFLHRLGDNPENDPVVFAMDMWPDVSMTDEDFPSIVVTPGSDYAIGKIKHGDANQLTLYTAPLSSIAGLDIPWEMICDVADSVVDYSVHGNEIYLLTSCNASRFRVVRTSLSKPGFSNADEILPTGRSALQWLTATKDALYVSALDGGMEKIIRVDFGSGETKLLDLPDDAPSGYIVSAGSDVEGVFIEACSWTRRTVTYFYDPKTDSFTDTRLNPKGKFDNLPGFESTEVEVRSHDGIMVPLSIIYKSGITLDGSNPMLLIGYGAYGSSINPFFFPKYISWLERGGGVGIAHVRGGGEHGQEWHLAGQKLTKPNTWKDFIACAEYLIEDGYTSPKKLAGQGGSAGGILIGRAITERPDLFAAAIINVGDCDMIRAETTTNGVPNIQEFGTVTKEEEFHALLAMSAFHHVQDGVMYPAVLLTHGINDPRVEPWMSAKMCARLQAATASGKPVLFRVEYHSGHGIGSTKTQRHEQMADEISFLLWQHGNTE